MIEWRIRPRLSLLLGLLPLEIRRQEGQTLVEYALILSLVAVIVIVAVTTLGGKVKGIFNSVSSSL